MTASTIAAGLGGRRSGAGFVAQCPAHDDKTPSFHLIERDGKVLVKCHAGCSQDNVLAALRARGLWPERERSAWTEQERRAYGKLQRERADVQFFGIAAMQLAEVALESLEADDPTRATYTGIVQAVRTGGDALLAEYVAWRDYSPELAGALVHAGRAAMARAEVQTAAIVRDMAAEVSNA